MPSLDALRGLAALSVVLHHCLLTDPQVSEVVASHKIKPLPGWRGAVVYTPLHILWNGNSAVLLFFVLSGFVLTRSFLAAPRGPADWTAYYPSRLARLYLPAWASLTFAAICGTVFAVPRKSHASSWVMNHFGSTNFGEIAHDSVLVLGIRRLDTPLWSLQWEVIFSLLLPLSVAFVRHRQGLWWWKLAAMGLLASLAPPHGLEFAPLFGVGALLANAPRGRVQSTNSTSRWTMLLLLGAAAYNVEWTWRVEPTVAHLVRTIGCALIVWVFVGSPLGEKFGRPSPLQWLGSRSFSLYLFHEPLVVALAVLIGPHHVFVTSALALPLALLVAEAGYRIGEAPSHRLSRNLRHRIEQRKHPLPSQDNEQERQDT